LRKTEIILLILVFTGCHTNTSQSSLEFHNVSGLSSDANELALLSWNIHILPAPYGWLFQTKTRAKLIVEKLKQFTYYDVILFQEVFDNKIRNFLFEELKYLYPFQIEPVDMDKFFKINNGLWALSRIPISLVDEIQFSQAIGWDWFSLKGAKLYQIQKNNQKFYIINTHLQADNGYKYTLVRKSQYTEIQHTLIEPNLESSLPLILCGDLNIPKLENLKNMLDFLNLRNGHLSSKLSFSYWDSSLKNPQQLLDYILVKENSFSFESIQRNILEVTSFSKENTTPISDHNPIEAILKWND